METYYFTYEQDRLLKARLARTFAMSYSREFLLNEVQKAQDNSRLEVIALHYGVCDVCSFDGLNVNAAKMLLSTTISECYAYPRLRSRLCYVGSKCGFVRALRQLCRLNAEYINKFRIRNICDDEVIVDIAKTALQQLGSQEYNKPKANVLAEARRMMGLLDGLVLDEWDFGDEGYANAREQIRLNSIYGNLPSGCQQPEAIVYHELGHLLDYLYNVSEDGEFVCYFQSLTKQQIESGLSTYGATGIYDFFAEAFSEYKSSPAPRAIANYCGKFLEKKSKA